MTEAIVTKFQLTKIPMVRIKTLILIYFFKGFSGINLVWICNWDSVKGITVSCDLVTTDKVHRKFGHYGYSQ
jgi:hypothetical protein